jgi:hypothetical protein
MMVLTRIHTALETLALAEMDAVVESHLERAAKESRPCADVLADLLEREVEARRAATCGPGCG